MDFENQGAQLFSPGGADWASALERTTHLAVGAHQDDIPIMAHDGILRCFGQDDAWFLGITVTDGAGSPRSGLYGDYTDDQMREVRITEEKKAAVVGEYTAAILLDYPSSAVKSDNPTVSNELAEIIKKSYPKVVYTHNLADKHDTHVGVASRTIAAIRSLDPADRPDALYGCEVWRDLDWMNAEDKVAFDVTAHANLAAALLGVYDSQIAGGKRYDLATEGRRLAHATFSESHEVDEAKALIYAMDLTPLITDDDLEPVTHVAGHINRMQQEISDRINRVS